MYILSAITGTDQVGEAFQKVNSNLNKQIVSGNTSGQTLNLFSKDGTKESISLSSVTSGYASTQALNSYLPVSSSTYFRVSGGSITGPVTMTDNTGIFGIVISGGQNTIRFTDDFNATNINIVDDTSVGGDYQVYLRPVSGDIIVLDPITNNQIVKSNSDGNGFDYLDISAGTGIGITKFDNVWVISAETSSGGTSSFTGITSAVTVGSGTSLFTGITNNVLGIKSISAGTNITFSESQGNITINSTASGGGSGVTGATNLGSGQNIYVSASTTDLALRTISGQSGIEATTSGNLIIIRPTNRTVNRVYVTDASGVMINSASLFVDNTNGTLGIGVAASTTSRLLLPAQTSTIAPLRFTKSAVDYTGVVDGSIWYLTAGDSLKFRKGTSTTTDFIFKDNNLSLSGISNNRVLQADSGGTLSALAGITNFGVFNSITSVTLSNSTSETSLLNTGSTVLIGTNILNSSSHATQPMLVVGKKFRFTAKGSITTKNSAAGTLNFKIKLGSSIISTSSAITLANNVNTPNVFSIETTFTVRSQGASGTVIGSGTLHCTESFHSGSQDVYGLFDQGTVTIDTTTDKAFDITAQFSVADSTNLINITESTLEFLN